MDLKLYQVDAFTDRAFGGNPAAVVPLREWLPAATMQAVAQENNLSETAFVVPRENGDFDLRWFTPAVEVDLCGHATLGAAWVLFNRLGHTGDAVTFHTRSGPLKVSREDSRLAMDFPAQPPVPGGAGDIAGALGTTPEAALRGPYALAVLRDEAAVRTVRPDLTRVADLDLPGLVVTAPGRNCDFVSRFFAPGLGINEDPVTGSAHCILIPYWAERFGKTEMFARQVSARGGALWCFLKGDRVLISGEVAPYMEGTITLD
ncbi:MAG: PhzF family phenazine biosynthesis protein [Gammaproteobacteria bacterium]|nr:PhzF family phenazine biosynthesis protein [Gammaproteobacteria bacterium]MDE0365648.1 PhzF family phenazine biosynthesis protein [Gammaproteobacteria bacterium]